MGVGALRTLTLVNTLILIHPLSAGSAVSSAWAQSSGPSSSPASDEAGTEASPAPPRELPQSLDDAKTPDPVATGTDPQAIAVDSRVLNASHVSVEELLDAAEHAMLEVDYELSLALAQTAIQRGRLERPGLRRAYKVLAVSAAQLDRHDVAQPAFLRLFALDPDVEFLSRLAPARRTSAMTAHGYWTRQGAGMGLSAHLERARGELVVTGVDPLQWWTSLTVWYRSPGGEYVQRVLPAQPAQKIVQRLELGTAPLDVVEVYVSAQDERGNLVAEFGSAEEPVTLSPSAEDRYDFDRDIRNGETGGFGRRLQELGADTSIHGYTSLEFGPRAGERGATFDLRHVTLFVTARLAPWATMEVGLDLERWVAAPGPTVSIPHAFLDLEVREWLVFRPGFFEAPIGAFNEYLYPDFLRTTALSPLFATAVVPALWSEVGVQVRGKFPVAADARLTYAVFVSNGLEQRDDSVGDGVVAEGGALTDLRFNARDEHNSDKAVGGRVGLAAGAFDVGFSGYTGRYTVDANRRLTIADVDAAYKSRWLTVRAEAALAIQELTDGGRRREGAYVLASSRAGAHLEPYIQYDVVRDDLVEHRILVGNGLYPFPETATLRRLRLKTELGLSAREAQEAALVWFTQLVSGF